MVGTGVLINKLCLFNHKTKNYEEVKRYEKVR